jgi:hypothetical protein
MQKDNKDKLVLTTDGLNRRAFIRNAGGVVAAIERRVIKWHASAQVEIAT